MLKEYFTLKKSGRTSLLNTGFEPASLDIAADTHFTTPPRTTNFFFPFVVGDVQSVRHFRINI